MAQDYAFASVDIMDDEDRLDRMVDEAAGIIAVANGKVKILQAMALVGFSPEETKNMMLYQKVRLKSSRVAMVELSKNKNGVEVVTVATNSSLSSFLHSATGQSSVDFSSPSVATSGPFSSSCSSSGSQKSDEKKPAAKVGRRTSKEVQRANSRIAQLTKKDKEAMKQATVLIHRSQGLPRNHPGKKSAAISKVCETGAHWCVIIEERPRWTLSSRSLQCLEGSVCHLLEAGASSHKEAVHSERLIQVGECMRQQSRL
jgi:hypothetical protein